MTRVPQRLKQFMLNAGLSVAITIGALVVLDLLLIAFGLFPPTFNRGHPTLGWVSAMPSGRMVEYRCTDFSTDVEAAVLRNEDGFRTSFSSLDLTRDTQLLKIAVGGDSHTDLCEQNEDVHFGVMQSRLVAAGKNSAVFAYGAGRYSPLQAYLAIRDKAREYSAHAIVLNLYTGNDFYDMLRIDDRPHFVGRRDGLGYDIAPPVWYLEDPPDASGRSRVLYALRLIADRMNLSGILIRVRFLADIAVAQGVGYSEVVRYMIDLRNASAYDVKYPQAFAAQFLNQQIFFSRFPGSRDESLRRVAALLRLIHDENPNVMLVMSPIPSYQVVYGKSINESLSGALERLGFTWEQGVAEEEALYEQLRTLSAETGWIFVDNLTSLRERAIASPLLYNTADYHVTREASEVIGVNQARALLTALEQLP